MTEPIVIQLETGSAEETAAIGRVIGGWLREGDVVLLHGDLGAGKTVLAKGIAAALRVDAVVASPSFALVNEYDAGLAAHVSRIAHLDLYRLSGEDDLVSIGYDDLIAPTDSVTLVEWPERAGDDLPAHYLLVEIETLGPDRRSLRISGWPADDLWQPRLHDLQQRLKKSGQ